MRSSRGHCSLRELSKNQTDGAELEKLRFRKPVDHGSDTDKSALPKHKCLTLARVRLDIAAMLARRELGPLHGPSFRYLGFDASPQLGREIFATVERTVLRKSLEALSDMSAFPGGVHADTVEIRRLPLATLGQGRASLPDRVHAHIHQCWLEYGGSISAMRQANMDVRAVLSDMGTEAGIGDYADVVAAMYGPTAGLHPGYGTGDELAIAATTTYLYPRALAVPGPQHIIDNLLCAGFHRLPWWKQWETQAKAVSQYVHPVAHRELLSRLVSAVTAVAGEPEALPPHDTKSMLMALNTGCCKFAKWRWQTLQAVTADLLRVRWALEYALRSNSQPDLGIRDATLSSNVIRAVLSADFWAHTNELSVCAKPLHAFSAWLRGCPCHELERRVRPGVPIGVPIECPWVGCRAPELAQKVQDVHEQMQTLRGSMAQGMESFGVIMSLLGLKFDWVFHLPFTVWQVNSAEKARLFLAAYDAQVEAGTLPHRVAQYLAGPDPDSLRPDMEHFGKSGHCSARLQAELLAYQACPLDETAIEAVHRDVSCIATRRATYQTLPFVAASLRMDQIFADMDKSSRFQGLVHKWFQRPTDIRQFGTAWI